MKLPGRLRMLRLVYFPPSNIKNPPAPPPLNISSVVYYITVYREHLIRDFNLRERGLQGLPGFEAVLPLLHLVDAGSDTWRRGKGTYMGTFLIDRNFFHQKHI